MKNRDLRGRWLVVAVVAASLAPNNGLAERHALLVGVNQYRYASPNMENLKGAVNDVKNFRQILIREYGFSAAHIKTLTDDGATLESIRRDFQELASRLRPDDTFVFHFSGHGTQIPDDNGDERRTDPNDDRDEALCPHDMDSRGGNALRDDELGRMLDALPARDIVVILDCCHSGTGTKDIRRAGRDRFWPIASSPRSTASTPASSTHSPMGEDVSTASGGRRRVVIAACTAIQRAHELDHELTGNTALPSFSSGSLTHYLVQGLRGPADTDGDGLVSYTEAHQFALRRINEFENAAAGDESVRQTPVLEAGDDDRVLLPVFGVPRKIRMHAEVALEAPDRFILDLGAIHAIRPGQRLGLYSVGSVPGPNGDPMDQIEITSVDLETAEGRGRHRRVNQPAAGLVAAPLADPLAQPDVWISSVAEAIDGQTSQAEAQKLLRDMNARMGELSRVRIDARDRYDLRLTIRQRAVGAYQVQLICELTEANGRQHDAGQFLLDTPVLAPQFQQVSQQVMSRVADMIREVRVRRSLVSLTNPNPGFGLQAVVNRRPPDGKTLAEYYRGDTLVFGLKSTADCHYYIVSIDPEGKPEVWCPKPGQQHFAPGGRKLLHPGPGERLILQGPPGVYVVKLLAVREKLPDDTLSDGLPRPEVFQALSHSDWAESSVSIRLTEK
ncbi:MAG: caspase family protein [Pirellulaceae bacterium]